MKQLFSLNRFFIKYKWYLIAGTLFVMVSNVFAILPPKLIRKSIDQIVAAINAYPTIKGTAKENAFLNDLSSSITQFALLVLLFALLRGLFMFFMRQTIIVMSRWVEFDQKNQLFNHFLYLPSSYLKQHKTGDLMSRISEDVGKVRMYVGPGIMYAINLIALSVMIIYAMLQVNVALTLWVLIPLPLLSIGIYKLNSYILNRSALVQKKLGGITSFVQESYSGIRVLEAFGAQPFFSELFKKEAKELKQTNLNKVKVDALFFPLSILLIGLSTLIAVYAGGLAVEKGTATAGNIAEFVIYVSMLTWPVTSIGWVASIIQQAAAAQTRINEVLKQSLNDLKSGINLNDMSEVQFENVSFTYPETGIKALDNINFSLNKGKVLGILGKTGSGKSTIAQLLAGFYRPTSGNILLGQQNENMNQFSVESIRSQLCYVQQDAFLFSDTILNNLKIVKADADKQNIQKVLQLSKLKDTIASFNEGIDTVLGERGITLSGGQKQRLAIARALLKGGSLFVFDDCLSALDTETEKEILNELKGLTVGNSTIIISHRISSLMHADEIMVLDNGRVIEKGSHETLMALRGYYAKMHEHQFDDAL